MIEFALVLPIFILLLVGLFDVGRAVFAYSTVNNAAREGARVAIVDQFQAHVQQEAASAAAGLGVDASEVSVTYELPDGTACPLVGTDGISLCVAVVSVPYTYLPATPIIGNLIGSIQFRGESKFPVSVSCATSDCPFGT